MHKIKGLCKVLFCSRESAQSLHVCCRTHCTDAKVLTQVVKSLAQVCKQARFYFVLEAYNYYVFVVDFLIDLILRSSFNNCISQALLSYHYYAKEKLSTIKNHQISKLDKNQAIDLNNQIKRLLTCHCSLRRNAGICEQAQQNI